jgi:hypothetical protein
LVRNLPRLDGESRPPEPIAIPCGSLKSPCTCALRARALMNLPAAETLTTCALTVH